MINRLDILFKFGAKCAYCGEILILKTLHVDHVIPKANFIWHIKNKHKIPSFLNHLTEDDLNHPDNLFPSCGVCNRWKSVYDLEQFRKEIFMQTERLNKTNASFRMAKRYDLIRYSFKGVVFYFERFNH
jgi:5-methylcytosine-specific restriction endonuclease McrA